MDESRGGVLSSPAVVRAVRWGVVAWSVIGLAILAYLFYRFVLYPIRIVFPPLVVAMIVVYLLNPIVKRLERRGVARVWGALLTYVVFLTLVGVGLRFLIPVIADQVQGFVASLPRLLSRFQDTVAELARRFRLDVDPSEVIGTLGPEGQGGAFLGRIFSFTAGVLHVAVIFILGPILAFYLLVDLPKIQRGLSAVIPARRRPEFQAVLERMGRALGGFFRGQLLVALFVGLASMLALWIVGLPYWAVVGMVAGLFNLIPLIGPFIGGVPALFIAFTTQSSGGLLSLEPGWPLALGASIALVIVQQIDNHILSPNIVARTVRLHPVTVMLGLLIGGTLLGLWGMVLAVPTVATVKILLLHYWDTRMQWPPRGEGVGAPPEEPARPGDLERPTEGERVAEAAASVARSEPIEPTEPVEPDPAGPAEREPAPQAGRGIARLWRRGPAPSAAPGPPRSR